jgi:transcriptional regulator with XRE-family HTH domain
MLDTMTPVTLTLKRYRKLAKMTQAELAESVGVRQATISDLENGNSQRIDFDVLDALCAVLTKRIGEPVTPGDLLKRGRG